MSIIFNEKSKIFQLNTKNTSYQMQVGQFGILFHLYYGAKVLEMEMDYLLQYDDRGFCGNPYEAESNRTFSLDTLPQEYPSFNVGDFRVNCIELQNENGDSAADYRYFSYEIKKGKYNIPGLPAMYATEDKAETLIITLHDIAKNSSLTLYYGVFEELDIITRAAKITNISNNVIKLEKALSVCLDFLYGDMDLLHFYGRHCMERQLERVPLMKGVSSFGSKRGTSSHQHNPFAILCEKNTTEDFGSCYGFSLVYSGNFICEVEVDQINQTRLVMGIHPERFCFTLEKEESFYSPEVVMSYSDQGFGQLSRNYHKAYRHYLCRGKYKTERRPILINNWEATYFDFTSEKLVAIAEDAKKLGIEMLVMDDGWFGKRNDDNSGLGDWTVNEKKIQGGLKNLVEQINAKGIKFGIWFEPEMVSEDSELYRAHPDWALKLPGRNPNRSRYQLVLDMSRKEVRDYLFGAISAILKSANIEYVKWDMNRSICDVYSAQFPIERQGEVSHRYILGLYELLEKITSAFPDVLLEGCSGGGGRFDAGMLYYSPQIWCSDDTDAVERLKIQYGTSFGYPISSMGSHVSASPNHQTGRSCSLKTRGIVAMSGTFGYELDINQMTMEEKEIIKEQIKEFKKYYDLIQEGDYYRLNSPFKDNSFIAWQFVSEDKSESLVNIVQTYAKANAPFLHVKLKGLNPEKYYKINGEERLYKGDALIKAGLPISSHKNDYQGMQFYLKESK